MRESRGSMRPSTSLNLSGVPQTTLAQEVRLRQSASGTGPAFCSAGSGTAYSPTGEVTTCTPRSGVDPVASEPVLVRDQVSSCEERPVPLASSAALVLRKY